MKQEMNDQQRLQLIESMIIKARNDYNESGTLYLMWGFVILFCSLTQFTAHYFFNMNMGYIWMLTWVAAIVQVLILRKEKRKSKRTTYTDEIIGYIWLCFFFCMMLTFFIMLYAKAYPVLLPAILVLYGVPTFLSGVILRFQPLKYGGLICWALAISSVLTPVQFQILYIAAAVLIAWIVPGIYLRKKYKKETNDQ